MNEPQPKSGRFGPLMQKLKAQSTGGGEDFDPTLAADEPAAPASKLPIRKRPPAKKNNPDYVQTTVYLKRDVYDQMGKRLIDEGRTRDFSDLVNDLLTQWLTTDS